MSIVCTSLNSLPVWLYLVAWFLKTKQAPIKVHIFRRPTNLFGVGRLLQEGVIIGPKFELLVQSSKSWFICQKSPHRRPFASVYG